MGISLDQYGKVISVAEYKIAKAVNKVVDMQYKVFEDENWSHFHAPVLIESTYYADDVESLYTNNVMCTNRIAEDDEDSVTEACVEFDSPMLPSVYHKYISMLNTKIQMTSKKDGSILLVKNIKNFSYGDSDYKTDEDYNYDVTLSNGLDFTITNIPRNLVGVAGDNIITIVDPETNTIDSVYVFTSNKVFMIDYCDPDNVIAECYDFTDQEDPNIIVLSEMENSNSSELTYLCILPRKVNINDAEIINLSYDEYGIIEDSTGKMAIGYQHIRDTVNSIHPMYFDPFNPGYVYNGKYYVQDQIKEEDKYIYYTRLLVEVDDVKDLDERLQMDNIDNISIDNYEIERQDHIVNVSKEEMIDIETKRIKEMFKKD